MGESKTSKNVRLAEAAARGEYSLVAPLDYIILDHLPEVGTLALGLYPLGETVVNLRKKFTPEQQQLITAPALSARVRVLHDQSLIESSHSGVNNGGKKIWQRTKTGTKILNDWKKGANGGGGGSSEA